MSEPKLPDVLGAGGPFTGSIVPFAAPAERDSEVVVTNFDAVTPELVEWLWPGRIPYRTVTLVEGDPGLGKSMVLLDVAARKSTGRPMPDHSGGGEPSCVIVLSNEDDLASVIVPRLVAAKANLTRLASIAMKTKNGTRDPILQEADLDKLEKAVFRLGARLVIVDPLVCYVRAELNIYNDHHMRQVLALLKGVAERTNSAVVTVRHWTKAVGVSALHRGGGSIGIIGAARSALVVAVDPDDETERRRVLAVNKSNLAEKAPSLIYHIEADGPDTPPWVVWGGVSEHTAQTLSVGPESGEDRGALEDAVAWLKEILEGGPMLGSDVKHKARAEHIAERTLWRAKARLRVIAIPKGGVASRWSLPDSATPTEPHPTGGDGRVGRVGLNPCESKQSTGAASQLCHSAKGQKETPTSDSVESSTDDDVWPTGREVGNA